LQINSGQTLSGVSILEVRRFFRLLVAYHHESFDKEWLVKQLQLNDAQGDRVLEELAGYGYVSLGPSQHKEFEYQITELAYGRRGSSRMRPLESLKAVETRSRTSGKSSGRQASTPASNSKAVTLLNGQPLPGRWRSRNFQSCGDMRPRCTSPKMSVSKIGKACIGEFVSASASAESLPAGKNSADRSEADPHGSQDVLRLSLELHDYNLRP
jgi:hypothetical protein